MGALALVGSTVAYFAVGPSMAVKCLGLAAHKSRIANKAFELSSKHGEREQWEQNENQGRSTYEKRIRYPTTEIRPLSESRSELVYVGNRGE